VGGKVSYLEMRVALDKPDQFCTGINGGTKYGDRELFHAAMIRNGSLPSIDFGDLAL